MIKETNLVIPISFENENNIYIFSFFFACVSRDENVDIFFSSLPFCLCVSRDEVYSEDSLLS